MELGKGALSAASKRRRACDSLRLVRKRKYSESAAKKSEKPTNQNLASQNQNLFGMVVFLGK